MKPEYLMLAKTFKDQFIGEWYASEKLDGERAFWDGGVSRGLPASEVPYANTVKDARLKESPIATGLWSRSGKVIHAPSDWLDDLPKHLLDGELYLGKGRFQELRKIVGCHTPGDWSGVKYYVFDSPSWYAFGRPRDIKIRNEYTFPVKNIFTWLESRPYRGGLSENTPYHIVIKYLASWCRDSTVCRNILQKQLSWHDAKDEVDKLLSVFVEHGGEGVMLRDPSSLWIPERCKGLLKYKPWFDAEGTITGFTAGRGKYRGMIGALILDFNDKRLELSGMTDEERKFRYTVDTHYSVDHPGEDVPEFVLAKHFKVGDTVTFKYRELSDDGIPKEARYWRQR